MEDDDLPLGQYSFMRKKILQLNSKVDESLSAMMDGDKLSFENSQSAVEEGPMIIDQQQTHQGSIEATGPLTPEPQLNTMGDSRSAPLGHHLSGSGFSDYSDHGIEGNASLWCRSTKKYHGELPEDWATSTCPACGLEGKYLKPQLEALAPEMQSADTAALTDTTARRKPQIKYSNKFLCRNGLTILHEPWPELLDLDRDRGKLATAQASSDEPVIEIVTVLITNLTPNAPWKHNTRSIIRNPSVETKWVGKEVLIHSRRVMDALQALITYYPGLDLGGRSFHISHPYAFYYHHRDKIKAFQNTYHGLKDDQSETEPPNPSPKNSNHEICDEETHKHLNIVQEFIERENLAEVRQEIDRYHQSPAAATYPMLWLLFKPGTKVYVRRTGSPVYVGVVLSIQGGDLSARESDKYSIKYWTLGFDGSRLGRCPHDFFVKYFAGERRISELEVSPCSYHDAEDAGILRNTLINRGQNYWRFLQGCQVDYQGKLPKDQSDWQGRVMVDPRTYHRYVHRNQENPHGFRGPVLILPKVGSVSDLESELPPPNRPEATMLPRTTWGWAALRNTPTGRSQNWQTKGPRREENRPWAEYEDIVPGPDTQSLELVDSVTGEKDMSRYLLCPPNVIGFDLKARQWQLFDVSCCHDVAFNHGAIDSLVMKEERKSVIKSLVHRYTAVDHPASGNQVPKPWTADFIKNKGEGQIFLLYGSPGVGKTYVSQKPPIPSFSAAYKSKQIITTGLYFSKTAECIAEATRRPLLSLICGDIGIKEVTAERTLSKWFRLAEIWGVVMLFDEADVFLEKRSISDLKRNCLVSAFQTAVAFAEYRFLQLKLEDKDEGEKALLEDQDFAKVCEMTIAF